MSKTYCIGDIHGGYLALKQALERSKFNYETDTLVQLGDLVDGNRPDWILCMKELQKINNLILLEGNHCNWFKSYLNTGIASNMWLSQGGQVTYNVYKEGLDSGIITEDEVKSFFNKQHFYYIDDQNRLFVHGGFTHPNGVKFEDAYMLMWDRDLVEAARYDKDKDIRFTLYNEIFVGHTNTPYLTGLDVPFNRWNLWNLDTGAGGWGKLTIMNVDTKEFCQSDKLGDLYPDIKKAR